MKKLKDGWRLGKVGDLLFGLESGVSVNGEDKPFSYSDKCVLKVSAVSYGKFDENAAKVIENKELSRARVNPKVGQIIISRSNTEELVGASAYIDKDYPNLFLPDKLWQTISKPNVNMKWLSYVLASSQVRYTLSKLATGTSSSMKNITQSELLSLKIMIPPLEEQIQIAETLSTWDNAIQTTEKLIENSRQQKKALMQRLLNGKNWEETKLQNLCKIVTGKKDVNEGNEKGIYPFFTCAKEHTYSDTYSFECEALLIAGNGVVGQTTYYNGKFEAYQRTYVLHKFKDINIQYLYQYIKWHLQKNIEREKQHGAMPYIKLGLLTDFVVKLPKLNEQQKIAEILSTADQEFETLQRKLECLNLEKGALMQRLLEKGYE